MTRNMKRNLLLRIGVLVLVLCGLLVAGGLWWQDATSPVDPEDKKIRTFVIAKGETVRSIATNLSQAGIIRSSTGFYILVKLLGLERSIQAGDFRLHPAMSARIVAEQLTHGIVDVWVTILEGWRLEEVAAKVARDLDIPEQEILRSGLEGKMFPDTYLIPRDATAGAVVKIFLDNFEQKVPTVERLKAAELGLTFEEVLILASLVEREGRSDSDRPMIAGILLNRLKIKMPLQVDATLQYALGYQPNERSWWKRGLTDEDKEVDSLYNTYKYTGLPPRPIASPGLAAIKAVLEPSVSDFLYYIHDSGGMAHYGRTIQEHNVNVSKYLQSGY